jgi:hypothetical protein
MAFITEYIPAEDIEKYGIKEVCKFFMVGCYEPHWTIDRDSNIYLRYLKNGREDDVAEHEFYFNWQGHPLFVRLHFEGGGGADTPRWRRFSNLRIGNPEIHYALQGVLLPEELAPSKVKIITDLKEILSAYKAFVEIPDGSYSSTTFDF